MLRRFDGSVSGLASLAIILLGCAAVGAQQKGGTNLPTPESVLGHEPGDDFYLASYDEALEYFRALDAASDKVELLRVGTTSGGLDWYLALISSVENLANLERHKETSRRLAWARGLDDEGARALSRRGKSIVHIDSGLHATKVAHAQHAIQLAYDLAASDDPEVEHILDNVILVLWFSINPDGQNMVVDWYRRNLGTPYEVSPLPWLYQQYVGHDNNRDGYMNNMLESRVVTRVTLEHNPQVFYDHHQTSPFPTRIWIPPFAEPVSSNVHPLMWRWVNVYGTAMAAYLDEHGMPGAIHRGRGFDDWSPGFIDNVNSFRNTVSFLTETALYRYATPHFYTLEDFPRDRRDLRSESLYASPWKGGWWRLGDAVRYMLAASMSVLDTSARYRENLLYNSYQAGRDTIRRFEVEPPFAYVIPKRQWDPPTANVLAEKLMLNGLELHEATETIELNGLSYEPGTRVLLMAQPFAGLAKELLEVQEYPDLRDYPGGPPDQPYDVSGWTLPLQMGVEVVAVTQPLPDDVPGKLRLLDRAEPPNGAVEGTGESYLISHRPNTSLSAALDVLAEGGRVAFVREEVEGPAGPETGVILASGISRDAMERIASENTLRVRAIEEVPEEVLTVEAPRIGLYRPWAPSMDEGWTRWLFEQFGFEHTSLYNEGVRAGHLGDRFDVIVLADISGRTIRDGYQRGTIPAEFAGGIGDEGVENLRQFVHSGGTLLCFDSSCLFAIEELQLPVENALDGLEREEFYGSGVLLHVEADEEPHPILMGMPRRPVVMFDRSPAFDTKADFRGTVLASYAKGRNPLASGYLLGPEKLHGKAAALDVVFGDGRVVLFGFRPQWRGQSHGTYKMIFNALFYCRGLPSQVEPGEEGADSEVAGWLNLADAIRDDLAALVERNRAFHRADATAAVEEARRLDALIETFREERLAELEEIDVPRSARPQLDEYRTQLKNLLVDIRAKNLSVVDYTPGDLAESYRLPALEKAIEKALRGGD
ncbi:MAG: M14 family metallopeptidase [Planctomycetota bacterium]|nr:M14 family metallopeptidase [Planctomycetota bacterium]